MDVKAVIYNNNVYIIDKNLHSQYVGIQNFATNSCVKVIMLFF